MGVDGGRTRQEEARGCALSLRASILASRNVAQAVRVAKANTLELLRLVENRHEAALGLGQQRALAVLGESALDQEVAKAR